MLLTVGTMANQSSPEPILGFSGPSKIGYIFTGVTVSNPQGYAPGTSEIVAAEHPSPPEVRTLIGHSFHGKISNDRSRSEAYSEFTSFHS